MDSKTEVFEALQECVDTIESLQAKELDHLWNKRQYKSEEFLDDTSDKYVTYDRAKKYIRKAMTELEDIFE